MIDGKDQLRAIYGFIFSFVTDENLVCVMICPFIVGAEFFSDVYIATLRFSYVEAECFK